MPFLETSNDSRLSDHPCPIGRNWYLGGGPNRTASSLCWHIRSSFFQRGSKCIIDSDSAINLLERQAAVDCTRFFSEYRVIVTEQAIEETSIGQLTAGCVFERHALDDKLELYERINDSIMELGPGERSAIAHALFMSNDGGDERIIIISDDKKARHTFERTMVRMESIVERFPHLDRITRVRSFEVLKRLIDKGLLDETSASGFSLSPVFILDNSEHRMISFD